MVMQGIPSLLCLFALGAPCAQEPALWTKPEQFRLSRPKKDVLVDLEMVVNYWSRDQLFVQSANLAIFVQDLREPGAAAFRIGDRVRIRGYFSVRRNCLTASSLELIGHGEPVAPMEIDFQELRPEHAWSSRVRVRGQLAQVCIGAKFSVFACRASERHFLVRIPNGPRVDSLKKSIGANITATGTMDWVPDMFGRPAVPLCAMMEADALGIEPVSDPPPKVSRSTLKSVINSRRETNRHVEVAGAIVCLLSEKAALIEDESHPVVVELTDIYHLEPGRTVRVEGPIRYRDGDRWPVLEAHVIHLGPMSAAPLAKRVTASQVMADAVRPQYVEVEAELIDVRSKGRVREVILEDDGIQFSATLCVEGSNVTNLKQARRVRVRGVVSETSDEELDFHIRNLSPDNIKVLDSWYRIDPAKVGVAVTAATGALGLGGLLVFLLSRQLRRKHRELTALTAQLNSAFESVEEGLLILDPTGRVLSTNTRFESIFGLLPQVGQEAYDTLATYFSSPEFDQFWQNSVSGQKAVSSGTLRTTDGNYIETYSAPISDKTGRPTGRLWAFSDVTQQRGLENQLLESQRLEAVGRLAGGIAHDFNNLLMGIAGNLELMQRDEAATPRYIAAAETATDRAAQLVQRLLGFSRQAPLEMQVFDPNETIRSLCQYAKPTFPANIQFETRLNSTRHVRGDQVQLEQVILNLCLNSRDAISDKQGSIVITTTDETDPKLKDCVAIEVSDTGVGMTDDVRVRIFEPFFSTKEPGHGIGLGLAMSFGIVEQHGGRIDCDSRPGTGTTFRISLPRTDAVPTTAEPAPSLPRIAQNAQGHILLADDERVVRETGQAILELAGFRVTPVENGEEALARLNEDDTIDVLVLDLTMPVMSGRATLRAASESHPQIPIIVCSGHLLDSDFGELASRANLVDLIQKPFRSELLLRTVGLAIERRNATATAGGSVSQQKDASGRVQSG